MLRLSKIVVAAVMTLTAVCPLSSVVSAAPHHGHHHHVFHVYYRTCVNSPWVDYGGYYHSNQARQAVSYFRSQGYEAFYR